MFGKFFGKKVASSKSRASKRVENRDPMRPLSVAACWCSPDGEIEKEETAKLDQLVRSNPRLSHHFGNEITGNNHPFYS
uniref:Uncharacterized protein n=1 Tax=Salmonella sp. TaxID=599 RepID=A0A482EW64_SALSP|nr:hypothetical protein NNIBIDOC_00190 [Salmonella sp.]